MGWLTGPKKTSKQGLAVIDGRQGYIPLNPFDGSARPNGAGDIYPDGTYANYTRNGYSRNELVYACIRYRAESLPQAVIRVYDRPVSGESIDDHRLRKLFEKPNPVTNEFELFEMSSTYKDLAGTCFWLVVKGRDGVPAELWPLRPDLVGVRPNPRSLSDFNWVYRPDPNRPEVGVEVPDAGSPRARVSPTFMIRVRYPNPNTDDAGWRYYGIPPLRATARVTSQDNAATEFVDDLLRNQAMPQAVVETQNEIDDTLHERLQSRWAQAFGGRNRGKPAFLQAGMKIHEMTLNLQELTFPDLRQIAETRICGAFGVEPILIGAKIGLEHNAYKDYHEARLSFWEEAMLSEQRRFIEPVRAYLLPYFTGVGRKPVYVGWDNSEVPAFKEAQGALWERATKAFQAGGITRNDFRAIIGLPPVPNGDKFLMPSGATEVAVGEDAAAAVDSIGTVAAEYGVNLTPAEIVSLQGLKEIER